MTALPRFVLLYGALFAAFGVASPFFPAYLLAGAWQKLRGRDWYLDNPFEREARELAGAQGSGEKPPARSAARR